MKLLLDANLSPRLKSTLEEAGFEVAHVGDVGLLHASDPEIFEFAAAERYVVAELSPPEHAGLLVANLPAIIADLERGVIVSLSPVRLAIRDLPIR
jgi:hypothetical protein